MKKRITELKKNLKSSKIKKEIDNYADISADELAITVSKDSVVSVLSFLKKEPKFRFNQLLSICGADYPERPKRFEVVYNLLSMKNNTRLIVKVPAGYNEVVPSISEVFANTIWYEREVWDMYGIMFADNPDLRRILTDYNFEGHPLRKDFPLTGHVEVRYDLEQKKVVYEPVTLTQDFRNFDFMSPWEGASYVLPGDEKATKTKK